MMKNGYNRSDVSALVLVLAAVAAVVWPVLGLAYSGGPPDAMTNAPGEGVCTACHGTFGLNSGAGSLTISGIGTEYEPGQTYHIEVTLADPQASHWGFEATAYATGTIGPVGFIESLDATTQVNDPMPPGRQYVKHTSSGTFMGQSDSASWSFDWTAPSTGTGVIGIYVAGNAADGSFNFMGDYIYAVAAQLSEALPNESSNWGAVKSLYR